MDDCERSEGDQLNETIYQFDLMSRTGMHWLRCTARRGWAVVRWRWCCHWSFRSQAKRLHSRSVRTCPRRAKTVSTNIQGFGIPFEIDRSDSSLIEVQLYLSRDRGESWNFYGRQSTDKTSFPFRADADGEYWFALKTLNRDRQLVPEGKVKPELIIFVDTKQPELEFRIETDAAGRVVCRWRAYDKNISPQTLKIFYQSVGDNPDSWMQVPVQLNETVRNGLYSDQLAWWPETTDSSLIVRLMIADTAGNTAQQERQVNVPASPWRYHQ